MKHLLIATGSLCLAAGSLFSADVARVRLELNGKTYVGQLVPEVATGAGLPTTKPATQPNQTPAAMKLTGIAPFQVHLDASDVVAPDALRDAQVTWDFGDAAGKYNVIDGFNAAHVYDTPGTFTLTRTLRKNGDTTRKQWTIDVKPAARRVTYVSLDGDDRNDGRSPERAVRTFDRGILGTNGGNAEVLFRRGDSFVVTRSQKIGADDCRIGAYGDASKPRPMLFNIGDIKAPAMLEVSGQRFIVEDLAFDAQKARPFDKAGTVDVVMTRGSGLVIRNCTLLAINYLINGNGKPDGVLLQDCEAPSETGIRSYFAWIEGTNWTILGNRVVNSTREHIVRIGGAERINIQFNAFANIDRREATTQPDQYDYAKGVLNVQKGAVLYVANNVLVGPSGVGPLGKADGLTDKAGRWVGAVVERNRVHGPLEVKHGASHVTYRENLVRVDGLAAFTLDGYSKEYGRGAVDIRYERNTVINAGKTGNFLAAWMGAKQIAVVGNVYIAPQLAIGANDASALFVLESDLSNFTTISGNVWPVAKPTGFAHNGIHYVSPKSGDTGGYIEPAAWERMPEVDGDRFEKINIADWASVRAAGVDASRLPGEVEMKVSDDAVR